MKTTTIDMEPTEQPVDLTWDRVVDTFPERQIDEYYDRLCEESEASGDFTTHPEYRANGPSDCDQYHCPEFPVCRGLAFCDFRED